MHLRRAGPAGAEQAARPAGALGSLEIREAPPRRGPRGRRARCPEVLLEAAGRGADVELGVGAAKLAMEPDRPPTPVPRREHGPAAVFWGDLCHCAQDP